MKLLLRQSLMDRFRSLKIGLGIILAFVGLKLILETYFQEWAHAHETLVIVSSLSVIVLSLAGSVIASVIIKPKPGALEATKVAER